MKPNRIMLGVLAAGLMAASLGCERAMITGKVVDVQGEALPGVAVNIQDTDFSALSNSLGMYKIRFNPGDFTLSLNKTGYTPGELQFSIDEARAVEATTAELWPLPSTPGVYVYENHRYLDTSRIEPRSFFLTDGDVVQALDRDPRLRVGTNQPLIICFKTPRYDARLSRLRRAEATRAPGQTEIVKVWTDAGTARLGLEPIDQARGLLLELKLEQPLEPGVYAVHWGALEGFSTIEKRLFVFEVYDPVMRALHLALRLAYGAF